MSTTTFPTTIDAPVNPISTDTLASVDHAGQHTLENTAVVALETKVGVDGSAVTTTHDYKLSGVTGTDKAVSKTGTEVLTNKTLTSPKINVGSDATGDLHYRASDGTFARLPIGTAGQILDVSVGLLPEWIPNPSAANASTTVKGVVEIATAAEITAGTATGSTGAVLAISPDQLALTAFKPSKFGGTGTDGALSVTSGNTNIDLGGAQFLIKNYTSISITGTGSITFINPHANGSVIHLKSQGGVTLTSSATPMIDASGCGGSGGAGSANSAATAGSGISASWIIYNTTSTGGGGGAVGNGPAQGAAGTVPTNNTFYGFGLRSVTLGNERFPILLVPGAGGGGGSSNNASPVAGTGGNGGGALYIECAGAWNFTTANGISVAGKNGNAGTVNANSNGGGGGGGAGTFFTL